MSQAAAVRPAPPRTDLPGARRVPGEAGIWLFVVLDVAIFAEMFGLFTADRAHHRALFRSEQHAVVPAFGLTYTLLLLVSSWCVAMAVERVKARDAERSARFVQAAIALGAMFALVKVVEYAVKLAGGYTPQTGSFFTFFYVVTFVHLLHTLAGLMVLTFLHRRVRRVASDPDPAGTLRIVQVCATYWHMVDLLWMFIFALFYLRS